MTQLLPKFVTVGCDQHFVGNQHITPVQGRQNREIEDENVVVD